MINYFGIVMVIIGLFLVLRPDLRWTPRVRPGSVGVKYRFGPQNDPTYHALISSPSLYYKLIRIGGVIIIIAGILYFFGIINIGFASPK